MTRYYFLCFVPQNSSNYKKIVWFLVFLSLTSWRELLIIPSPFCIIPSSRLKKFSRLHYWDTILFKGSKMGLLTFYQSILHHDWRKFSRLIFWKAPEGLDYINFPPCLPFPPLGRTLLQTDSYFGKSWHRFGFHVKVKYFCWYQLNSNCMQWDCFFNLMLSNLETGTNFC